jgi:hypothetical protein
LLHLVLLHTSFDLHSSPWAALAITTILTI